MVTIDVFMVGMEQKEIKSGTNKTLPRRRERHRGLKKEIDILEELNSTVVEFQANLYRLAFSKIIKEYCIQGARLSIGLNEVDACFLRYLSYWVNSSCTLFRRHFTAIFLKVISSRQVSLRYYLEFERVLPAIPFSPHSLHHGDKSVITS